MCFHREGSPSLHLKSPYGGDRSITSTINNLIESHVCSCMEEASGQLEMSSSYVCWHSI